MAGKPAETHLRDTVSVMMGVSKGEVKTKLKKGALRMKQFERPSNEKGGAPQGEVHRPNIEKLAAYINAQDEPERFAKLLFAFCKPSTNDLSHGQKKM